MLDLPTAVRAPRVPTTRLTFIERVDGPVEFPSPSGRCWFGQLEALRAHTIHPHWPDPLHSEGVDSATYPWRFMRRLRGSIAA